MKPAPAPEDPPPIVTSRLCLRQWRDSDLAPFAELNADPRVMAHFPAALSRMDSDAMAGLITAQIRDDGWGLWAVERRADEAFLGFVGLKPVHDDMPFAPAVEAAWRQGFAMEAATAAIRDGFERVGLRDIVAFTPTCNEPSWRLMERLGMTRDPLPFHHPALSADHRLCLHYLYRLRCKHTDGRPS